MPQPAALAILLAAALATIGLVALGATFADGWFDEQERHAALYVAAAAPFLAMVLAGFGGSRMGIRTTPVRRAPEFGEDEASA